MFRCGTVALVSALLSLLGRPTLDNWHAGRALDFKMYRLTATVQCDERVTVPETFAMGAPELSMAVIKEAKMQVAPH